MSIKACTSSLLRCKAIKKTNYHIISPIVADKAFFSSRSTADFGFKDVNASDKEHMVKEVFSKVAHKYDVMNDLMSVGAHRLWKDELINMMGLGAAARMQPEKVPRHLDVAGGTGDVAFRVVEAMYKAYGNGY